MPKKVKTKNKTTKKKDTIIDPEMKKQVSTISNLLQANARVLCIKDTDINHGISIATKSIEDSVKSIYNKDDNDKKISVILSHNGIIATGVCMDINSLILMGNKDIDITSVNPQHPQSGIGLVSLQAGNRITPVAKTVTLLNKLIEELSIPGMVFSDAPHVVISPVNNASSQNDNNNNNNSFTTVVATSEKIYVIVPINNSDEGHRNIYDSIHLLRAVENSNLPVDALSKNHMKERNVDKNDKQNNLKSDNYLNSISDILDSTMDNVTKTNNNKTDNDPSKQIIPLTMRPSSLTVILVQSDDAVNVQQGLPTIDTSISSMNNIQKEIAENDIFRNLFNNADKKTKKELEGIVNSDINNISMINKIPQNENLDMLGGYEEIKEFIRGRRELVENHSKDLIKHGILLKGVFLFGVPGCGKTTMARCIGNEFGIPAYMLDLDSGFDKMFGASETNLRRALNLLEQQGMVTIVIDEIDKLFAGVASGNTGTDVPIRLFRILLEFMSRDNGMIFCVTANALNLKEEFMRKGRFDRLFFVGLPKEGERSKIVDMYAKKDKISDIITSKWRKYIVSRTKGYTGADIENAMKEIAIESILKPKKDITNKQIEIMINDAMAVSKSNLPETKVKEMYEIAESVADNRDLVKE